MTSLIASIFRTNFRRRATISMLNLDDHLLNDIGLSRLDLRAELVSKRNPARSQ